MWHPNGLENACGVPRVTWTDKWLVCRSEFGHSMKYRVTFCVFNDFDFGTPKFYAVEWKGDGQSWLWHIPNSSLEAQARAISFRNVINLKYVGFDLSTFRIELMELASTHGRINESFWRKVCKKMLRGHIEGRWKWSLKRLLNFNLILKFLKL